MPQKKKIAPRRSLADRMAERTQQKAAPTTVDRGISPIDDMIITGNTEIDDGNEVAIIQSALRDEKSFFNEAFDMAFYIPIVFQSRAQVDAWLAKTGLASCLSPNNGYVNGLAAAKLQDITLPPAQLHFRKVASDTTLVNAVGTIE